MEFTESRTGLGLVGISAEKVEHKMNDREREREGGREGGGEGGRGGGRGRGRERERENLENVCRQKYTGSLILRLAMPHY